MMNIEEQLCGLLDREAIRDVITGRYSADADWLDTEDFKDCFTQDSEISFGTASMGGHDFCEMWANMGGGFKMRYHLVDAARIFLDGDSARAEARAIVASTYADPTKDDGSLRDHLEGSRYFFDLVREADGAWRISKMHIVFDWTIVQAHARTTAGGAPFTEGLDTSHSLYKHMMGKG